MSNILKKTLAKHKRGESRGDGREIAASDAHIAYAQESATQAPPPLQPIPVRVRTTGSGLKRGHRRAPSDSSHSRHRDAADSPKLERHSTRVPEAKKGRAAGGTSNPRGSFRKSLFLTQDELTGGADAPAEPNTKKRLGGIKHLLRARANTRDKLQAPEWLVEEDLSSERSLRDEVKLPLTDTMSTASEPATLSARSRARAGGMTVPKNLAERVEGSLETIYDKYSSCQPAVQACETQRTRCEELASQCEDAAVILRQRILHTRQNAHLDDYRLLANGLLETPLKSFFRFGVDQLIYLDDRLVSMERRASKSIQGASVIQSVVFASVALFVGILLAFFL